MRMRNPKNKDLMLESCDYYYEDNFDNNNPIHLEIGMGKGQFILNMALNNPNINFIGVEKYSSVASVAIKKINEYKPSNLKILIGDIANIQDKLTKKIDTIYLNFSDPWPKDRHAKRRLTSDVFLEKYEHILKEKHICMKTDNRKLFEYSVISFTDYGYKIKEISLDLYKDDISNNIPTEYEKKFVEKGFPIYKIEVYK